MSGAAVVATGTVVVGDGRTVVVVAIIVVVGRAVVAVGATMVVDTTGGAVVVTTVVLTGAAASAAAATCWKDVEGASLSLLQATVSSPITTTKTSARRMAWPFIGVDRNKNCQKSSHNYSTCAQGSQINYDPRLIGPK